MILKGMKFFLQEEYPTYHPYPGWIEQSPEDWWNAVIHGLDTLEEEFKSSTNWRSV